jgi:hypothetical protein
MAITDRAKEIKTQIREVIHQSATLARMIGEKQEQISKIESVMVEEAISPIMQPRRLEE